MNKWLRAVCVGAAAAAMLTASAFAANYTNCADSLHEMGLFQGTQNGYDLDRTPTRAEAAVMLVRLLGKEAEVKALTYTAPFTDLKGWEKPYIQYLYSNGLANGMNRTNLPSDRQVHRADVRDLPAACARLLGYGGFQLCERDRDCS